MHGWPAVAGAHVRLLLVYQKTLALCGEWSYPFPRSGQWEFPQLAQHVSPAVAGTYVGVEIPSISNDH